jgi:hypothetical protein
MRYFLFFSLCISSFLVKAQNTIQWLELPAMPERVSNNAVCAAEVDGVPYVFSFTGIDTSKDWHGIHLKAFRYNTNTQQWDILPDVPDPNGGKIAAGASTVKNKIYIIGGYHVASTYIETSSNKVHVFDPQSNDYLSDGAPVPIAIDDHVQAVWRDSLIYVITGWSNSTNVPNVQIYNPSVDTWMEGTPVPNTAAWKVFGGSGVIIGDTIYYMGGARALNGFPPSSQWRKGVINPNNPSEITWEAFTDPLAKGYRMATGRYQDQAFWLGGSLVTYNFDGIAYSSGGGVQPIDRISFLENGILQEWNGLVPAVMDLRGLAQITPNTYIIAGGMEAGQSVSDRCYQITIDDLSPVAGPVKKQDKAPSFYPNPCRNSFFVDTDELETLRMFSLDGTEATLEFSPGQTEVRLPDTLKGLYVLQWKTAHGKTGTNCLLILP